MLQCESRVLSLNLAELLMLCEHLKIKKELTEGKTKFNIVKTIRNTIENDVTELQDGGNVVEYLNNMDKFFVDLHKAKATEEPKTGSDQVQSASVLSSDTAINGKVTITTDQPSKEQSVSSLSPAPVALNSLYTRRDFKIVGQIGEPGQKDKLLFQSLVSQIENGLKKGYKDPEIIVAVIRAVQPVNPRNRRACSRCAQTGSYCNHCFHCGRINHFARDCPSRTDQGNGRWLTPRDQK